MPWSDRRTAPVRRAQLVVPFGVGAMMTNQDGVGMITAALDYWYRRPETGEEVDTDAFVVEEDRLADRLSINELRLPPDFRTRGDQALVSVPAFLFPRWHVCPECRRLRRVSLTTREKVPCPECRGSRGQPVSMYQVRFIAVCEAGHLQDFPWEEWVHETAHPTCDGTLRLDEYGGGTLGSIFVRCTCGAKRSLAGITGTTAMEGEEQTEGTVLSERLQPGGRYTCPGHRPWTGEEAGEGCGADIRGSLRNASNVYFAEVRSSLYLPRGKDSEVTALLGEFARSSYALVRTIVGNRPDVLDQDDMIEMIRKSGQGRLRGYTNAQIREALKIHLGLDDLDQEGEEIADEEETQYRRTEYRTLLQVPDHPDLTVRDPGTDLYADDVASFFRRILLVERLRETRALTGFRRVQPGGGEDYAELQSRLWASHPGDWLPASVVRGEGIFLELDPERVAEWEGREDVQERVTILQANRLRSSFHDESRDITPRMVLIHTLAHLLINRLVFECGYSTASLRERLYVSTREEAPMAGLLIYTAAGDADGTMGGLVRMGRPGYLEPVLRNALREAVWCSSDPICMEAAERGGQGPDSCNLAACHNCAIVPETSCEEFNRFLDRGLVIGWPHQAGQEPRGGYFG